MHYTPLPWKPRFSGLKSPQQWCCVCKIVTSSARCVILPLCSAVGKASCVSAIQGQEAGCFAVWLLHAVTTKERSYCRRFNWRIDLDEHISSRINQLIVIVLAINRLILLRICSSRSIRQLSLCSNEPLQYRKRFNLCRQRPICLHGYLTWYSQLSCVGAYLLPTPRLRTTLQVGGQS